MSESITIQLTPQNQQTLEQFQMDQSYEVEEIVNRALSNYFFSLRFDEVRAQLSKSPLGEPIYTEDDILNDSV